MSTLSRKQREIKQREERILELSRPMLIQQGYHGLSMDRIADALEYSKGTIYNHFSCKEEIIIALAIQTMDKRTDLFQRAAATSGGPRERITAIGTAAELFVRLYPDHFSVEHIIRAASIWEKASERRRQLMRSCEQRCIGIVGGIIRDAVSRGDLSLPDDRSPEDVVFGLWSMSYGAYSIIATSQGLDELGISEPFGAVRANLIRMLDGYGWRPLSTEVDYEKVTERIKAEVFADEFRAAEAA